MPLVSPNKRDDEEQPQKTAEEVFVDQTRQKTTSFFQAIGQMGHRTRSAHMPVGVKQLFHDIWYGNLDKKTKVQKPLQRWKWLWASSKPQRSKPLKPYRWTWDTLDHKKRKR